MNEKIIQITSGRGPVECCRVVAKVLHIMLKEARALKLDIEVIETIPGPLEGSLSSANLLLKGKDISSFIIGWCGTVQWIAQSPYRKYHKRKNWFVGVEAFDVNKMMVLNEKDIEYKTLKASGPGGQHVNKTESAVRAKHIPSGISVMVSERRSQLQNKKEAKERLQLKLMGWQIEQAKSKVQEQWQNHNSLERGNAIRTFQESLL